MGTGHLKSARGIIPNSTVYYTKQHNSEKCCTIETLPTSYNWTISGRMADGIWNMLERQARELAGRLRR